MSVLIATHGDVDGMTCAAQILRIEGMECELLYSNASHISDHLAGIARRATPPVSVYVADIPADSEAAASVETLSASGAVVHWIDHHPWPDGLQQRLKNAGTHIIYREGLRYPAGVLLGEWLADRDPYCRRIANICYASKNGSEWERDWFRLLSSQVARCGRDVLERLALDEPFSDRDRMHIANQIVCEQDSESILAQPPPFVTTSGGRSMAAYDTSATAGVFLGAEVYRRHKVDYCIHRISVRKWQVSARSGAGLNLECLRGHHVLAGFGVSGGGRNTLLSISAEGPVPSDAHAQIVCLVAGLL